MQEFIPIAEAITKLFHPFTEVVIHDLKSNEIAYIAGKLSPRQIGDPSLLDLDALQNENDIDQIVYDKFSVRGKLIKSISIFFPSKENPTHLMCINADVSIFEQLKEISDFFLTNPFQQSQPTPLFQNDWQEKLHQAMFQFCSQKFWDLEDLNTKKKKELAHFLFQQGAFEEKKAADYIANTLQMGRATVFNYLKEWKKK